MKLGKYILGLALIAVGLTSCDKDNIGAIYEPTVQNVSFLGAAQSAKTDQGTLEVPVAIGRAMTDDAYTATVSLANASEGVSLKSNQVTFAPGEGIAYATVVFSNMEPGTQYTCDVVLSETDKGTANTDFGQQVTTTKVAVMCDYNWISAGTCTFTDYTWGDEEGNPVTAEGVPVQNAEGTNLYRIVSPLYYVYKDIESSYDMSDFEFTLNSDNSISVEEGSWLNFWGYWAYYYPSVYGGYCYIEQAGNTYGVNFLLLNGEDLYTGGYFEFTWNR